MAKYNLSKIMKQAWNWFNDEDVWTSDIEWMPYNVTEKTFANCLKASWAKAKEEIADQAKEVEMIAKSEEVKAWDWACKKLGIVSEVSASYKYENVKNEAKRQFGKSVWQVAMSVVRQYQAIAA